MSQFRPVNFNQASVRANELVANTKLGIGTHSQTSELHIKAAAPELQIEGASATMKVVASGTETTFRSDQDVKWTSADAGTVHMTLDGTSGDVKVHGQTIYPNKLWNIDLTGESNSVYYPIVFQAHYQTNLQIPPTFISISGQSLGGSDLYNENTIVGYVRGGAQTDHRPFFDLRASNFNAENRISGIWYNNPGSFKGFVVYARGGYAYNVLTDALSVSGETSAYSSGGGTFAIKNANGTDSSGTSANIERIVDFYNRTRDTNFFHASSGSTYVGGLPQDHAVYGGEYDAVTKCVHVNSLPQNMMKMMLPTSGSTTPRSFPYALQTSYIDSSGNSTIDYVDITKDPFNRPCQVFRCKGTNGGVSGGWGGIRIACHPSRSYMSVIFVKRSGGDSSGASFYHGCDGSNTVGLNGSIQTNPYFHSISYNSMPNSVWCVSIGFVHFYGAGTGYSTGKGGLYRLDTMAKIVTGTDYAFRYYSSYQSQRAFFYNNTTSGSYLDFWNPGWYEHQDMNSEAGLLNLFTNDLIETSDDRLKSDERFIRGALDTIMKLKPQVYKKKITLDDTVEDNTLIQESGLVAQEIYYDAPELRHLVKPGDDYGAITNTVQTSDDPAVDPDYSEWGANPASVNYRGLIPYTVKAIQEMHTEMPRVKYRMTGVPYTNLMDYVGMCVRSVSGDDIVLSSSVEDKAVVGVVSATQNSSESENSDVLVETRGRGYVWVLNTANVSVGEYLTTSNVCGYAQRQGDDLLHSYTVAKALQSVDFVNNARPRRVAKKALSTVKRWVRTTYRQIPQSVYDKLSEGLRRQSVRPLPILDDEAAATDGDSEEIVYEEIIREESRVEIPGFELEVREEMVDDLDEYGQMQWEDDPSGATEPAYKIRYLAADGTQTDEANAVHIAAFVACTYHCG